MKKYKFARRSQWNDFVGDEGRVVTEDELQALVAQGKLAQEVVTYLLRCGALVELPA